MRPQLLFIALVFNAGLSYAQPAPTSVPTGAPSVVVNLSPLSANLMASGTQTFTAAVAVGGGGGSGVTWSISPNVGTLVANGSSATYTAPSSITSQQLVAIKAASVSNPAASAQSYINLQPAAPTPSPSSGNSFYVSPTGSASGNGSISNPWNIATALNHPTAVKPGDTVWLRNGTYGNGGSQTFNSRLTGTSALPIYVRQYPGERATINGGFGISGKYAWYWGFEVANLNWPWRYTSQTGSFPGGKPADSVFFTNNAVGNKLINMIIRDGADGIADQTASTETEAYGNLCYNNGWDAPDRGHGHNFYYQNPSSTPKIIAENIGYNSFDINFQAYGSAGPVQYLHLDGNIIFNGGVPGGHRVDNIIMAAGGVKKGIVITNTVAYNPTNLTGVTGYNSMDATWTSGLNEDVTLKNNYWIGGYPTGYWTLLLRNWKKAVFQNNLVVGPLRVEGVQSATWGGNTYHNSPVPSGDTTSTSRSGIPSGVTMMVRPNKYEKGRANIVIMNWAKTPTVTVDLSNSGLKVGAQYDIRDSQNFWGPAVFSGTYNGSPINLPIPDESAPVSQIVGNFQTPPHTSREFGAFILIPRGSGGDEPTICNPAVQCAAAPVNCSYIGGDSCNCGQLQCSPVVDTLAPSPPKNVKLQETS